MNTQTHQGTAYEHLQSGLYMSVLVRGFLCSTYTLHSSLMGTNEGNVHSQNMEKSEDGHILLSLPS